MAFSNELAPPAAASRSYSLTDLQPASIRVLLMENISEAAVQRLEKAGYHVDSIYKLSPEDLKAKISSYHIIGVRLVNIRMLMLA